MVGSIIVAVGEGANAVRCGCFRNLGAGNWVTRRKTEAGPVKLIKPLLSQAPMSAERGAVDLIVTQGAGAPLLLKNHGAEKNGWMEIDLKALMTTERNRNQGRNLCRPRSYQKWEVMGASGYLGQSALPIHVASGVKRHGRCTSALADRCGRKMKFVLDGARRKPSRNSIVAGAPARAFFLEWPRIRIHCRHDRSRSCGHWIAPGNVMSRNPHRIFKSFRKKSAATGRQFGVSASSNLMEEQFISIR